MNGRDGNVAFKCTCNDGGARGYVGYRVDVSIAKPVVFSSQANYWHCRRLAGIEDRIEGFGRLLREY